MDGKRGACNAQVAPALVSEAHSLVGREDLRERGAKLPIISPPSIPLLRPHLREEQYLLYRGVVGEQHHQAVHAAIAESGRISDRMLVA